MALTIHQPYPGVAMAVAREGSVLFGAPADAFKATKKYCADHELPFPRTLVAPRAMLVEANPQFNPEFFLYDFLFVYGAAFKPELEKERLDFVVDASQVEGILNALRITLTGPTPDELRGYTNGNASPLIPEEHIQYLTAIAQNMAIKKGDRPRVLSDSVRSVTFDSHDSATLFDGAMTVTRDGPQQFDLRYGNDKAHISLAIDEPVVPFATIPTPTQVQTPQTFGVKALGTRSGFDLSGPTTGFVFWVNGRAVIYDGPVGTRYLLESQGISGDDIEAVILSHCHEDHMGAFVELILAGQRPKVYTTEPIYRSALIKLASYFQRPEDEAAQFVEFNRVTPGVPVDILGATFEFFYTVHSIPTVGVTASMSQRGKTHQITISGDTMHHEGLDKMLADGALTKDQHARMKALVPDKKVDHAIYFTDVGEAIIHGHPKDWQGNPNDVYYYHCPDSEHTRSFGHDLAMPGGSHILLESGKLHPAVPARLLNALASLDVRDPGWFTSLLHQGILRKVKTNAVIIEAGAENPQPKFAVIVSGSAVVLRSNGSTLTSLRPGEFFGAIDLIESDGRNTATIKAETPMELFEIDAGVFHRYIQENGLDEVVGRMWTQRPMVETAKIFRGLDLSVRNELAKVAVEESFNEGTAIIEQGNMGDDFYLLVEGSVQIESGGKVFTELASNSQDNFFGEISAIYPKRPRGATVRAKTRVRTLRIRGGHVRRLFEQHMGVRYALELAIRERGGPDA